ncbi:MAG: tRNA guanosine(34) transglycosylase Tgt [Pirellulaceae bacterium]
MARSRESAARRAALETPRGIVQLPAFMPVGTQGTVKGLTSEVVRETGAEMVLANTYHLAVRPGADVVEHLGGLHRFMDWEGPILTDSGGFQVFSLERLNHVDDQGVVFRSHVDGRVLALGPERAVEIQELLGSDIAMVLDHVVALPAPPATVRAACERTVAWAERCQRAARRPDQTLFAIVQGGLDAGLRRWCAERLGELDFAGYAVGGLSVGETASEMYAMLEATCPALPQGAPRYLMGVGRPQDILESVRRGIDLFDCVMPTRNGRNALAFTDQGPLRLRNRVHRDDPRPLESHCRCAACRYSRGYLHHLFKANEMLGPILLTIHNLTYYQRLMADIRAALEADQFLNFMQRKMAGWAENQPGSPHAGRG